MFVFSQLDLIQAIVPSYLVSKFKTQLELGCSYIMQNFKVSSNDFSFKSTDHKFKLIFCGSTSVKKVQLADIPLNHLKLIGINAIIEGKYRTNLLYGELHFYCYNRTHCIVTSPLYITVCGELLCRYNWWGY